MIIVINNTSSPGASFTENTNSVLLKTYDWVCKNSNLKVTYKDLRTHLEDEYGINENNNRNIFPLLKNMGFVEYEKNITFDAIDIFTNEGIGYIKTLLFIKDLEENDTLSDLQKISAIKKCRELLEEIIYNGLKGMFEKNEAKYISPFKEFIMYMLEYKKISKEEYAYFLYERFKSNSLDEALKKIKTNIDKYRNKEITFETEVEVRNDNNIKAETKQDKRKEALTYLTSYGYFTNLLEESGLIEKDRNYYSLISNKQSKIEELIKEV